MNKKIIILISFLLALNFTASAQAENSTKNSSDTTKESFADKLADTFILKSAMTIEYQGMGTKGDGQNGQFKNRSFWNQLKNFDDIALGANFRVHKYLGFNLNWSKNTMKNGGLNGYSLADKASLNLQNINATSVLYFPIIGDQWMEGFAEIGVSDVKSELKFIETNGQQIKQSSHETALLYGAGIQFMPYYSDIAFRFGFQKYQTNLGLVGATITTFRGGVVIPF